MLLIIRYVMMEVMLGKNSHENSGLLTTFTKLCNTHRPL